MNPAQPPPFLSLPPMYNTELFVNQSQTARLNQKQHLLHLKQTLIAQMEYIEKILSDLDNA